MNCYENEITLRYLLDDLKRSIESYLVDERRQMRAMGKLCEAPNTTLTLIKQLNRCVEKLADDTSLVMLQQNSKIADAYNYLKEKLDNSIRDLIDSMEVSGELAEIITEVAFADLLDKIEKRNVYYDGITSEKLYDDTSKTTYYVTKIPYHDSNGVKISLKLGVAGDSPTANQVESTLVFAARKNATVCVNAGVYNIDTKYPVGSLIKDSQILYTAMPTDDKYQYLGIKGDGSVKVYPRTTTPEAMLNDGVVDATCIFGSLILDGVAVPQTDLRVEPRQSIGFDQEGNILIITCEGRTSENLGMSYDDLARLHYKHGSYNAYILDGGGSSSTVIRGVKQNDNIDYLIIDRPVNNFLYVAKPTTVSVDNNAFNEIGRVKQEILARLVDIMDFDKGFIRLKGGANYFAPGIEMYVNAEASRRSKLGLSFDATNQRNTYLFWGLKGPEDTTENTKLFRIFPHGVWVQLYHGPTSSRPNATGLPGLCYFDETLKKPIWYNGSAWVDATGSVV